MTLKETVNLTARQDSSLKLYAIDSQFLNSAALASVKQGEKLSGQLIDREQSHLLIELDKEIQGTRKWFLFTPHWAVESVKPEADKDITFAQKEPDRGRQIKIPGISSVVHLNDSISKGSPNFRWYEATHAGTRIPTNQTQVNNIIKIANEVQKLRDRISKPFIITSWFRPEPFNSIVGGASNSRHLQGGAIDFRIEGMTGKQMAKEFSSWSGGLGIYPWFPNIIHLDVRGYTARWGF